MKNHETTNSSRVDQSESTVGKLRRYGDGSRRPSTILVELAWSFVGSGQSQRSLSPPACDSRVEKVIGGSVGRPCM